MMQGTEPVLVQTTLPELAVERLDACVLRRLSWLDEMQLDVVVPGPEEHGFANQLRAVVTHDGPGNRTIQLTQEARQAYTADQGIGELACALPAERFSQCVASTG